MLLNQQFNRDRGGSADRDVARFPSPDCADVDAKLVGHVVLRQAEARPRGLEVVRGHQDNLLRVCHADFAIVNGDGLFALA